MLSLIDWLARKAAWAGVALCLLTAAHSASADATIPVPPGFVLQKLDIIDGRIARPSGWTYTNGGTATGWLYTIAREPDAAGYYKTGLRIQLILQVSQHTNLKASAFAEQFLAKKKAAAQILSECRPAMQEQVFTRRCLETKEVSSAPSGAYPAHIAYTLFYSDERDTLFLTTFGAPEAEWEQIRPIARTMETIMLIGPKCCGPDATR